MSKPLAGTKTEKNLWTAFAGESQARNKYDYFAGVARKEGFQQLSQVLVFHAADKTKQFFVHVVDIFSAYRKVIGRIVFSLLAKADSFYADLKRALEGIDIAVYLYVIQAVEFGNARAVGIPDLGVNGAGFVLKYHIVVSLTVFGHR